MKKQKNKKGVRGYPLVPFLSILLIAAGLFLAVSYSVQWAKGYFAAEDMRVSDQDNLLSVELEEQENSQKPLYQTVPKEGEKFGYLSIPTLDTSIPIYEGTDEDELAAGIGHFAGSVLPGENNNSVLSGHRDTVFRRLGEVGENDLLIVTTSAGEFTYRVQKVRIVEADDRTVIVPKPEASLTVTTCYPFSFIGNAPQRYVLVADLIDAKATPGKAGPTQAAL